MSPIRRIVRGDSEKDAIERVKTSQDALQDPVPSSLPAPDVQPVLERPTAFIACADLHLRDDTPTCRTDDYQIAQMSKFHFLCEHAKVWKCPIMIAGDVFDTWKPSHRLVAEVIRLTRGLTVIAVPGQHDMPSHNLDLLPKSGLAVLREAGWDVCYNGLVSRKVKNLTITGYAFGEEPPSGVAPDIILWHKMTWTTKVPYPGCKEPNALKLLKKYKNVKLIITGDNHIPFVVNEPGQSNILVNPGSMMRMSADQQNHRPRFYVVSNKMEATAIYWPIEQGVVSDAHLIRAQERDSKLEAFVARIDEDAKTGMSFEENMKRFLETDKTKKEVRTMVAKAMEGE